MKTWTDFGVTLPAGTEAEVDTTCPQCSAQRRKKTAKCLSVNRHKGTAICFHCGWTVSLESGRDGTVDAGWARPKWRLPDPTPTHALPPKLLNWLTTRGISTAAVERNQVAMMRVYMPQAEAVVETIAFPYFRDGVLVNRKYRGAGKMFRMHPGAERILYKLDDIAETTIICEGEPDALALETAGFPNAVSVPDGAPAPGAKDYATKFSFLDSAAEKLARVRRFVLAVDNDAPGRTLEDELARRLGRERCWRVQWPAGCKDANDVLIQHGVARLRECIETATEYPIEGLFSVIGLSDKVELLYDQQYVRGVSTGWASLDQHYTVRPGELTIVTGTPSAGKSNFVDALMVNLAEEHGWQFGVFSPENQPVEDHVSRLVEKHLRLPFSPGRTPRMTREQLRAGLEWGNAHFHPMLPRDEGSWDIAWILGRAKELVTRKGIRGLVIDPWNELEPQRKAGESETEYVSRVLRTVRQFGREHGVHIWLVAHPTKLYRDKDTGKYPVPTLWDCAGSAHFRNKADCGLCVWRDLSTETDSAEVDIHVQKIRFRQVGRIGKVTLRYDPVTARYDEVESDPAHGTDSAWAYGE